jgi:hypothetical protein
MRCRIVFGEDSRAVVSGHDEDRIDGEQRERSRHCDDCCFEEQLENTMIVDAQRQSVRRRRRTNVVPLSTGPRIDVGDEKKEGEAIQNVLD